MAPNVQSHPLQLRSRGKNCSASCCNMLLHDMSELHHFPLVRYGLGVGVGVLLLKRLKNGIRKIPVVGPHIARVFPAIALGAAAGATVVYGIQEGDLFAVKGALFPSAAKRAQKRAQAKLAEVQSGLRQLEEVQKMHKSANDMVVMKIEEAQKAVEEVTQYAMEAKHAADPNLTWQEEAAEILDILSDARTRQKSVGHTY